MKKTIIIACLIILAGGLSFWLAKPSPAQAGKIVFKRNVVFRAFYALTQNGSAGALVADYAFYTQANGGVDDYNNAGSMPADSYSASWTTCASGNNWCNTATTTADKKDNSTGLVWSGWLESGTAKTWFWANNCYEPGTAENPGTCVNDGDNACQCVKKTSSKTGCEAIGAGWRLPHQKELMQVYIDGSRGNLSSAGNYYWSATAHSYFTQYAWYTDLSSGYTRYNTKTNTIQVRCVRW